MGAPSVKVVPWRTFALAAGALVAYAWPGGAEILIYDRAALAHGEAWRLLSGHLVHYSAGHLLANLALVAPVALLVELRYRRDFVWLLLATALAIGCALFLQRPEIVEYAGLSGVALAFLVYACLRGLHEQRRWRIVCAAVLAVVCAKLWAESVWGWSVRDWRGTDAFVSVALSHLLGAATGAALYCVRVASPGWRRASRQPPRYRPERVRRRALPEVD